MLGALDQCGLAAKPADRLRHLDADRPAAQNQETARDRLHARDLTVGPDSVELAQAGNRWHDRIGAVRQHDVFGGVAHAVDLDDARPGEPARAAQQVDAVVCQPALLAGVGVVGDHEVAPGECGRDVDLGARSRVARGMRRLAGAQQGLGGDARPVGALTPDQFTLHECDPQAAVRKLAGAVLAGRAAAQDDDVVVGVHVGSSSPRLLADHLLGVRVRRVRVFLAGPFLVVVQRG